MNFKKWYKDPKHKNYLLKEGLNHRVVQDTFISETV